MPEYSMFKTVPTEMRFIRTDLSGSARLPVAWTGILPRGSVSMILPDLQVLQVHSGSPLYHPFTRGIVRGLIGPDLRMHVELAPGTEKDEILAAWESASPLLFR